MNLTSKNLLLNIVIIQFILYVTVVFNIPIARQVIGFLYLTFIPGIILLRVLQLDELEITELIIFSAGLSIAFLMFTGLLINELGSLIGILKPLSLFPLMIILNGFVLVLSFSICLKDKNLSIIHAENIHIAISDLLLFIPLILSVIGVLLVNAFPSSNYVLLLMIISISVLVIYASVSKRIHSKYPLILLIIAVALLLHVSLVSSHLNGQTDIHLEYYLFKFTEKNSYWSSNISYTNIAYARTNSMLSVTLLPTIFSELLNMEGTWILKIVYPLIFSLVPLGLYHLYKRQIEKRVAFMSTFFFMANFAFFYEIVGIAKQMIAELFFILLFIVLLNKKMSPLKKRVCFIIFSGGLILSHYSMAYIFLFIIVFTMVFQFFMKNKKGSISISFIVLFFTIQFAWYIYSSRSAPFNVLNEFIGDVSRGLSANFFKFESRGRSVQQAIGLVSTTSFGHSIGRIFAYATQFFIVFGFLASLIRRKKMAIDLEYLIMSTLSMTLLMLGIILPFFARGLNMIRFYHIELFFLAPFCILGGKVFFEHVLKRKTKSYLLVLIVLVPFFLYQTDFIYEITRDDSWSIPLSKYRMDVTRQIELGVLDEQDVVGAQWLSKFVDYERIPIYADYAAYYSVLGGGYGMIYREFLNLIDRNTIVAAESIVYLRRVNTVSESFWVRGSLSNFSEINFNPDNVTKIYSNGGCEIYKNLPYNITSPPS